MTSSGLARYSRLLMMALMQTDLPLPVCPAMSIWGIFARSHTMGVPVRSLPSATVSRDLAFCILSLVSTSRRVTVSTFRLGTSTPTRLLPGIGASMRMEVASMP